MVIGMVAERSTSLDQDRGLPRRGAAATIEAPAGPPVPPAPPSSTRATSPPGARAALGAVSLLLGVVTAPALFLLIVLIAAASGRRWPT